MPAAKPEPAPAEPAAPHFYVATEPLYHGDPESGVLPVRAFAAGDLVPAHMVEPNGWQAQVRHPDEPPPAPPQPPPPPRPAPATGTPPTEQE
jgi:hypothetical protein